MKSELDKCFNHYSKGLTRHLGTIVGHITDHLLLIMQYTVIYVEKNIAKFSKTLGCDITSEYKLDTALSLLCTIPEIKESYGTVFLENSVNFMVRLLFNNAHPDVDSMTIREIIVPPVTCPPPSLETKPQDIEELAHMVRNDSRRIRRKSICSRLSTKSLQEDSRDELLLENPKKEKKNSGIGKYLTHNVKGK
jgi:hypothetical protein